MLPVQFVLKNVKLVFSIFFLSKNVVSFTVFRKKNYVTKESISHFFGCDSSRVTPTTLDVELIKSCPFIKNGRPGPFHLSSPNKTK